MPDTYDEVVAAAELAHQKRQAINRATAWPELTEPTTDAIARWLASKQSEHTRTAYQRDLRRFTWWAHDQNETLETATASTVETWATTMLADGASTASVARRSAAVSSFYTWAGKPGRVFAAKSNPAGPAAIDRVKQSSIATPALSVDEAAALVAAARRSPHPARDTALTCLLLSSGARVSEVCAANIADLSRAQGGCQLQVRTGKGGKARTVAIDPTICDDTNPPDTDTADPLLLSNSGQRLCPDDVTGILKRLQRSAQIWATVINAADSPTGRRSVRLDDKITPHVIRATFATVSHEAGAPIDWIQHQMGHASPTQTQDYIQRTSHARTGTANVASLMALIDPAPPHGIEDQTTIDEALTGV